MRNDVRSAIWEVKRQILIKEGFAPQEIPSNIPLTRGQEREKQATKYVNIQSDNSTALGTLTLDWDYANPAAINASQAWVHWFETESQEPAAQNLTQHLN